MSLAFNVLRRLPQFLRSRLLRRAVRVDDRELEGIEVAVAETVPDLVASARLLHDAYVARGLIEPQPGGVRTTPYLLLPSTVVLVARHAGRVVATMSLVPDSPLGLPMERTYPAEVEQVRAAGRRVAEVGALCIVPGFRRRGVGYLLNKLMWRCAEQLLGVDDLLISVVPPADCLYEAALLFRRIGPERHYHSLRGDVVTVPLRLDLRTARAEFHRRFGARAHVSNPFFRYCLRTEPQLRLPADAGFRARGRLARLGAAKLLAPHCRDELAALPPAAREHLAHELPHVGLAAAPPPRRLAATLAAGTPSLAWPGATAVAR